VANETEESVERALEGIYDGYAFIDENDRALACMGVKELSKTEAHAWTVIAQDIGTRFVHIHACADAYLSGCGYDTVYMDTRKDFTNGLRWGIMLGFVQFEEIQNYYDDGGTAIIMKRERI
jgi:hypothetical protein